MQTRPAEIGRDAKSERSVEIAWLRGIVSLRLGRAGSRVNFESVRGGSTPPGAIADSAARSIPVASTS